MTITTSRRPPPPLIHSGYNDLVNLVASTPSRLGTNLASQSRIYGSPPPPPAFQQKASYINARPRLGGDGLPRADSYVRLIEEQAQSKVRYRGNAGASSGGRGGRTRGYARGGGRVGAQTGGGREEWKVVELRKRKIDKKMIGHPKDFRHIFHASTYEEATELLLRWSIEGLGDKLGDPAWAYPIKELVKARAREQQARAVAAVVEATARSRELVDADIDDAKPPGTLRVVNGLPSSIYSTTNTLLRTSGKARPTIQTNATSNTRSTGQASVSPLLTGGSTPNVIANFQGYFETPSTSSSSANVKGNTQPLQIKKKSISALPIPVSAAAESQTTKSEEVIIANIIPEEVKETKQEALSDIPTPSSPPTPRSRRDNRPKAQEIFTQLPFRVIKPSLETLEKSMSIALFFEQYYHALLQTPAPKVQLNNDNDTSSQNSTPIPSDSVVGDEIVDLGNNNKPIHPGNYVLNRARRLANLESTFNLPENLGLTEEEKNLKREELLKEENRILRERRKKVDVKGFELGRVIGHGAFGVVRIAREKQSGRLVAMKQLRKADMLRKSQEGHVRAEKDLLAAAASQSLSTCVAGEENYKPSWIVQLYYAFQDNDHLYLVLEFMGGGDLLNLLVERDTFSESMTKFYISEMIMGLEETHSLGFIHRDIKPDNFLFTKQGHIRISDFGLATDLHWIHDTNYYEQQRLSILKKHGIDLEYPSIKTKRMKKKDIDLILGKEWESQGKHLLTWREDKRRNLAYSVCGTNSYMAPEVIRGQGYGFSCDWWSLGVIMYESLYGYPPFVSSSRHVTRQKILNWKTTLKFPPKPRLSPECLDLMTALLCEPEDRLGTTPNERSSILSANTKASNNSSTLNGRQINLGKGLGNDGAELIKKHKWFEGIDWDNLHKQTPPYHPDLYAEDDTRHFDDDIPDEPLAPANGAAGNVTKDPLLRDKKHGEHLLEIRKSLAFKGWTFKSPALVENRYGHLHDISHMKDISEETIRESHTDDLESKEEMKGGWNDVGTKSGFTGTVRNRALSF
ncbi:uncharacterized protein L201_006998 [Kwoniella dendrophila CBS 6074]|uniref:non-specific serine/threonine protein kinase n=1 Tax=Kwoniella dendrophila CBS 6074 TaxID=1295534 RepID=A0AAX4K4E0_9TREE